MSTATVESPKQPPSLSHEFSPTLKKSWALFRNHWGVYVLLAFYFSAPGIVGNLVNPGQEASAAAFVLAGIEMIFYVLGCNFLALFTVNRVEGKQTPKGEILQDALRRFPLAFLVTLVLSALFLLGTLLFVIPGFIAMAFLCFAPLVVVLEGWTEESPFRISARMAKGNGLFLGIFHFFYIVVLVLLSLGVYALGNWIGLAALGAPIGVELLTGIPYSIVMTLFYLKLK